jgi:hypothetical protein
MVGWAKYLAQPVLYLTQLSGSLWRLLMGVLSEFARHKKRAVPQPVAPGQPAGSKGPLLYERAAFTVGYHSFWPRTS